MPNLIPPLYYEALTPYNHLEDNARLSNINTNLLILNNQVDLDANILRDAVGTAGSLSNRLNQSLNEDGSIKSVAIDDALHSIEDHLDSNNYVRMTMAERAKLSLIADEATNLSIRLHTVSGVITFDDGFMDIENSDTITWRYEGGSVYADNDFPESVRHIHYYGLVPVHVNLITPDYINYKTTSIATPYKEGSLRVFINGVKLSPNTTVGVPIWNGSSYSPVSYSFSEGTATDGVVESGLFSLSAAISASIKIYIDFDVTY